MALSWWAGLSVRSDSTGDDTTKSALQPRPCGLTVLADGTDPVLDIVAVHGLNGHRQETWTKNGINWLRDFLPADIPKARIFSWGYDANTHGISPISSQYLYDHAMTLVSDLCQTRRLTKTERRPILFIAHSLGGIIVKSALIHSDASRKNSLEEHRSIKVSTYGILFMGTPHQGGNGIHLGQLMLNVASIFVTVDDKILKHLERDSEYLQQQLHQYGPIGGEFVTKFCYETLPTPMAMGKMILVVPKASAVVPGAADAEPIAIPANHQNMVRFASREDGAYDTLSGHLQVMVEDAPSAVSARWEGEDMARNVHENVINEFSLVFSLSGVPEVAKFVGRREELLKINYEFQKDRSQRKVVILHGLGGLGKTQLAVTFAKEHRSEYTAICWMNGKTEATLKQSFTSLARRLHNERPSSMQLRVAAETVDADQTVDAIKKWFSMKGNTGWLLIFDNVDNPKLPGTEDPQAYDVTRFFPEAHQGHILITTRSSRLKLGESQPLRKLTNAQESLAILSSMSGRSISASDPYALQLIAKLDGLPLALATAGAYLSQVSTSFEVYLNHYNNSWLKLQQTSPKLLPYEDRALYTTWNISLKHIQSQNESAGKLLQLWAYFDNQDVWFDLLAAGRKFCPEWFDMMIEDELTFNEVVRLLCDHGFIEVSEDTSRGYSMHTCVHAWTMHVLNIERDIPMATLALNCVGRCFRVTNDFVLCRRLLPHALLSSKCLDEVIYLHAHGHLVQTCQVATVNVLLSERLALIFKMQYKFEEAETVLRKAVEYKRKLLGPEHISTLYTSQKLSLVRWKQGKREENMPELSRVLEVCQNTPGSERNMALSVLQLLATSYNEQGKTQEAENLYLQALRVSEGNEMNKTQSIEMMYVLGTFYVKQRRMKEAEALYLRALDNCSSALSPGNETTLMETIHLGCLRLKRGQMKEAETSFGRALDICGKHVGYENEIIIFMMIILGSLYFNLGRMDEAESLFRRALDESKKASCLKVEIFLFAMEDLSFILTKRGDMKEAEALQQQLLNACIDAFGPEYRTTLSMMSNLATLHAKQGKRKEAEALFRQALKVLEKLYGSEDFSVKQVAYNLRLLHKEQGRRKAGYFFFR